MKKQIKKLTLSITILVALVFVFPSCFGWLILSDKKLFKLIINRLYSDEIIPCDISLEGKYRTNHIRENTFVFYGTTTNKLFLTNQNAIDESYLSNDIMHLSDTLCARCAYWVDESDFSESVNIVASYIKRFDVNFEWTSETKLYRKLTRELHNTVWVVPTQNGIFIVFW